MAYSEGNVSEEFVVRVGLPIVLCTGVLTLGFFGVLALATEQASGIELRVPVYVLGAAVTFVGGIVGLDRMRRDGVWILAAAAGIGVAAFAVLLLGGEGALYLARHPDQVIESRRLLYLLAAGLVATGLGYWSVRHLRSLRAAV
jgi:hypothetical protein